MSSLAQVSATQLGSRPALSLRDHMHQGDYGCVAREMLTHLGSMAAVCAIDREAQARFIDNVQESRFWAHVCREIIAVQTAQ